MNVKVMGLVIAGGIALAASQASAVELARYSFTGAKGSTGASGGQVDTQPVGATLGVFGGGGGITLQDGTGTNDFRANGFTASSGFAADANDYYSFTFTPNQAGFSITDISFTVTRTGTNGPRDIAVRGSLTGTTDLFSAADVTDDNIAHTYNAPTAGYSSLTNGQTVTFFIFGSDSDSTAGTWAIDDVIINGTGGGIPEPASIGLVALGATALIRRRRA